MKDNKKFFIDKSISKKILMIGVYYKNHAPGGVASVVSTYSDNIENLRYVETVSSRDTSKVIKLLYALRAILKVSTILLIDRRIKILHVQGSHGPSFYRKRIFVRIAKCLGKKVIWHMHASSFIPFYEESTDKKGIVASLNMADKLIVLSKSYYDFYKSIGIDESKIVVLNNIVPRPLIKSTVNDGKIHFLFLGEISKRKGAFDLISAIAQHKNEFDQKIEVRIGGNGEIDKLEDLIKSNEIENIVKFEGWVSGDKKIDLLNWCDVYILPSFNEGLPISILEAMSYSHPIISTPVGGILEVLHDGENGIVVNPGNVNEIYNSLSFFVNNRNLIKQQGETSEKLVQPFFPESVFMKLKSIYESLIY